MGHIPLLLACLVIASPAAAFIAKNDLRVSAGAAGTIEVDYGRAASTTDFWCAAGDFAARALGAEPTDRLYRISQAPRRSGEGMSFSLSQPDTALPISFLASQTGEMTVSHAKSYCGPTGPLVDLLD